MTARKTWFTGILIEPDWAQGPKDPQEQIRFWQTALKDLGKIAQTQLGMELLKLIMHRHQHVGTGKRGDERIVTIRPHRQGAQGADAAAQHIEQKFHKEVDLGGRTMKFAGKGSKTFVLYHNGPQSEGIYTRLAGVTTPTWLALAHELIHALHHLSGTTYREKVTTPGGQEVKREEMFTTGLGPYQNTRMSENAIRREVGLKEREYYTFAGDAGFIKALAVGAPIPLGMWVCNNLAEVIEAF
jgi:Effector protein